MSVPVPVDELARLRSSSDIADVLRASQRAVGQLAAVHVRDRDRDQPARLAVIASRRVGGAVARNRAKRLLREAARHRTWAPGADIVLVARPACSSSRLGEVLKDLDASRVRLGLT